MNLKINYTYAVIIPHYNDILRLKRLLKSIPIRNDIQIIIVDDYSDSYNDLIILCNYFEHSIQLTRTKKNSGAGVARNIGLSFVKSRYVLFADSDDEFTNHAFEIYDNLINDECDLIYTLAEGIQERSGLPSVRANDLNEYCTKYLETKDKKDLDILKINHCVPWAKIYKYSFLQQTRINHSESFVSNDIYFNVVNAVLASCVKVSKEYTYRVYRLQDSLTSTTTPERFIERVYVSAQLATKLKDLGYERAISGTGFILASIGLGPKTFIKIFRIVIHSDMKLEFKRIFNIKRWLVFIQRYIIFNKEKNN